jgi:Glyoxalase-like domain
MPRSLPLLLALPLMAQQLHVDHATVAGNNLQAMVDALRAAGVPSEPGGPHSNHATEMALTSFPDGSYLELIAVQPQADPAAVAAHYWHAFLATPGEPCSWAIRPANLPAEVDRLRAASVLVSNPQSGGRKRPDGVDLRWENSQVGPTNGGFFPFMIHDLTPRERRAYPSGKPTTTQWSGIVKVVIGVKDLNAAIAQYQRAYALPAPERQEDAAFGAKLAWFRGTPVVLAAPLSAQSWLDERVRTLGEAPCAIILGQRLEPSGGTPSHWFGKHVVWADTVRLSWHLGFEAQ